MRKFPAKALNVLTIYALLEIISAGESKYLSHQRVFKFL
jgi:hypothetical protein